MLPCLVWRRARVVSVMGVPSQPRMQGSARSWDSAPRAHGDVLWQGDAGGSFVSSALGRTGSALCPVPGRAGKSPFSTCVPRRDLDTLRQNRNVAGTEPVHSAVNWTQSPRLGLWAALSGPEIQFFLREVKICWASLGEACGPLCPQPTRWEPWDATEPAGGLPGQTQSRSDPDGRKGRS